MNMENSSLYIYSLAQDCGNLIASALELPQRWTKPVILSNHCNNQLHIYIVFWLSDSLVTRDGKTQSYFNQSLKILTHGDRETHICVSKLPVQSVRCQAIIQFNDGLSIGPPWKENEINLYQNMIIFIKENSFENVVCKMASICLSRDVLIQETYISHCAVFQL